MDRDLFFDKLATALTGEGFHASVATMGKQDSEISLSNRLLVSPLFQSRFDADGVQQLLDKLSHSFRLSCFKYNNGFPFVISALVADELNLPDLKSLAANFGEVVKSLTKYAAKAPLLGPQGHTNGFLMLVYFDRSLPEKEARSLQNQVSDTSIGKHFSRRGWIVDVPAKCVLAHKGPPWTGSAGPDARKLSEQLFG